MKESQLENKTAIATNDYMRMVDENGNSVKIKKDSFMAAIRDALPSIISDGVTGEGSVLSIINGALKSRTDANLASVLGGEIHIKTGSIPKNTPTELVGASGIYIIGMFSACLAFTVKYWIDGVNYLTEGGADQSFVITHNGATNKITVETSVDDIKYIYIGF